MSRCARLPADGTQDLGGLVAPWSLPPEVALAQSDSRAEGLSDLEAGTRRRIWGANVLPTAPRTSLARRFTAHLVHPMALLLWIAGALAFVARTAELGWAIWAVVLINAAFTFWQDFKAERTLAELERMVPLRVRVRREGKLRELAATELVPGDVVELEAGDRVPADARWIEADRVSLDLSVLTGESQPVARHAEAVRMEGVGLAEIPNLALTGATVVDGRGAALIYATAAQTVLGQVARLTAEVRREPSTLEVEVGRVVRVVTTLSLAMGVAVFLLGWLLLGMERGESFIFAIGIIVANVPEGLLPTVTLSLAVAVQRMARQKALVRRLSAVETLSAVDVICTDKTGTLTENEMTVRALWIPTVPLEVTGCGYDPRGEIRGAAPGQEAQVRLLLAAATLCSNARLVRRAPHGQWHILGDPTEGALLVAAVKARLRPDQLHHDAPRLREVAFDSRRKMMSVVRRWHLHDLWSTAATHLSFTKGAPMEVVARCTKVLRRGAVRPMTSWERAHVTQANDRFSRQGYRVLALAFREGGDDLIASDPAVLESDLTLLGLTAMLDPPREGVREAVDACRKAGIRVTMLTGDYGLTAEAVARAVGLIDGPPHVVSGTEIDDLTETDLEALLGRSDEVIFSRATPEHKLRIVEAYQRLGHVVAATGDGVNDAPALRAARVGVAMGRCGTDVAREAADIVLLDDNFATIVSAIEQGRAVYANLRKFMTYILTSNVPEIVPFVFMVALRIPPALTVLQILAVDLGTDMFPALALGADPPDPGVLDAPPRRPGTRLLDRALLLRSYAFLGMVEAGAAMASFGLVWWLAGYDLAAVRAATPSVMAHVPALEPVYRASTAAALVAIVAVQMGNLFACRSEHALRLRGSNRLLSIGLGVEALIVALLFALPGLARVFHMAPLPAAVWALMLVWPPLLLGLDALWKMVRRSGCDTGSYAPAARSRPM